MKKSKTRTKQSSLEHGGRWSVGKRKIKRPVCEKRSMHLVLKSNRMIDFYDYFTFIDVKEKIEEIIRYQASKFGVKVYEIAVQADHVHLAIYVKKRENYVKFIRAVTAHFVRTLSKLLKVSLRGIFNVLPYSKIISWGKEFKNVINYILINQLESLGFKNVRGGWFYEESKTTGEGRRKSSETNLQMELNYG